MATSAARAPAGCWPVWQNGHKPSRSWALSTALHVVLLWESVLCEGTPIVASSPGRRPSLSRARARVCDKGCTMFCGQCGLHVDPEYRFCRHCGVQRRPRPAVPVETQTTPAASTTTQVATAAPPQAGAAAAVATPRLTSSFARRLHLRAGMAAQDALERHRGALLLVGAGLAARRGPCCQPAGNSVVSTKVAEAVVAPARPAPARTGAAGLARAAGGVVIQGWLRA